MDPSYGDNEFSGARRGPWKPGQTIQTELRQPKQDSDTSGSRLSDNSGPSQSTLSVDAKEFVPRNYNSHTAYEGQVSGDDLQQHEYVGQSQEELDYSRYVNDILLQITNSPDRFDDLQQDLLHTLPHCPWLFHDVIEKCISESNFTYSGARLCISLMNQNIEDSNFNFMRSLKDRIDFEYSSIQELLLTNPSRLFGFAVFLGELYKQQEAIRNEGDRIPNLAGYLYGIIHKFGMNSTSVDLKYVCQILKLTGAMLEAECKPKMDEVIRNLGTVSKSSGVDTAVRNMILSVLRLQSSGWGQCPPVDKDQHNNSTTTGEVEPVMYGPDGQELSLEESSFLYENTSCIRGEQSESSDTGEEAWDPEMDEEMVKAFKVFLIESKQNY